MSNFFIPKKINVGYQERSDTYTGKLAYIIYFDDKGKLRKETSWNGWRDKKIDNNIYDNEPMSGFVLNKKAGGYSAGWNHRQTYVRVYDPRGFEFEITVPNLLYILENATSTKGKGLEGDFVYGWDGKDLVLIPCEAPDYKELKELNELRHKPKKIGARDLVVGRTYLTNNNSEWVYMGRFHEYSYGGVKSDKTKFWFYYRRPNCSYFETITSPTQKLINVVSEDCVEDYAELYEQLERTSSFSPIDESKTQYVPYTLEEFIEKCDKDSYWFNVFSERKGIMTKEEVSLRKKEEGKYGRKEQVEKEREVWLGYGRGYGKQKYMSQDYVYVDSIEELFNILKPHKKLKYLENGKFYDEVTY